MPAPGGFRGKGCRRATMLAMAPEFPGETVSGVGRPGSTVAAAPELEADRRLAAAILQKDRKAAAELVASHADAVFAYVRRRLAPRLERVDDLVHDVFLSALAGLPSYRGTSPLRAQGLYYDTFVAKDPLPMEGRFQLLVNGTTEFGPGDPGYLGGRWWEDLNLNGVQDAGDHFFLGPLLPLGRQTR